MGSPGDFDFWLGTWRAHWEGESGPAYGENTITKRFGGKVVYEHFSGRPGMDFEGMSVSVYSPELDAWLQTWVDDQGNYWDLVGHFADGEMTLLSSDKRSGGKLDFRMRFFNIRDDAFEWTWERSSTAAPPGSSCGTSTTSGAGPVDRGFGAGGATRPRTP